MTRARYNISYAHARTQVTIKCIGTLKRDRTAEASDYPKLYLTVAATDKLVSIKLGHVMVQCAWLGISYLTLGRLS